MRPSMGSALGYLSPACRLHTTAGLRECDSTDQLSWLSCHNAAFHRLAGVAAVNRIDNTKTAVVAGAGAWGEIHPVAGIQFFRAVPTAATV